MNADSTPAVTMETRIDVGVPHLSTYALAGLLLGFVALAGGILLMVPPFGPPPEAPTLLAPNSPRAG